ncbi:MAG: T9SS type A sorting domain-containing protein [Elusimicrobia bacterium]|nr:T9SS type A sorting domain-containing protein [Elusimicrobiota bacterium]
MKKIISIVRWSITLPTRKFAKQIFYSGVVWVGFVFFVYSAVMTGGNLKIPIVSSSSGGQKSVGGNLALNAANMGQGITGGQMEGGNYSLLGGAVPAAVTFAIAKKDLSDAHCYPTPFKPSLGHDKITFTNLTRDSEIKIYTISGELIKTLNKSDANDSIEWNAKTGNGENLASGVYIYMIKSASQAKKGKLMIIK